MAKTIRDEDIRLSIIINGNQAQKEIYELDTANRKLIDSNKEIRKDMQNLVRQGKKQSEEYGKLNQTLNQNSSELEKNKIKIRELENSIGITNLTLTQLRKRATELRVAMNNMVPESAQMKSYSAELTKINTRISELTGKAKEASLTLGSIADKVNRYQSLVGTILATLAGVYLSFSQFMDFQHKLSDAMADVMKTTGLTKAEVDELSKSFTELHTRTSRINLLKIAEEGGRIGIAKNEMLDFVRVMDRASVALGDSFTGGVEEVSSVLGKLKFLFSETKEMGVDAAYNAIGSAINDLGASGVATEQNIANFATRIGALPNALKPTIAEALALGASFEESGIEAEISARAYNIFLRQAATDTEKFARVMNLSTAEVKKMINENPVNFFLEFSKRMRGLNEDGVEMARTLDYLGINADGANKIVGAAANNTERFRESIDLANKSMSKGTSMLNEFTVKNNNVAATLDKISKKIQGWFSSESLTKFFETALDGFAKFIGVTEDTDGTVTKWRENLLFLSKIILIVTASVLSYKTAVQLAAIWTNRNTEGTLLYNIVLKAQNALTAISIARTQLFAAAQMLLRGNIKGAIMALRALNIVLSISPWGAVIALVAACTAAYFAFREETEKVISKQKILNEVNAEAEKSISKEVSQVQRLLKVAKDEKLTKEQRLKAIEELNKISPKYLGNLKLETIGTEEAAKAIGRYIQMLRKKAQEKAFNKKLDEIESRKTDAQHKKQSDYDDYANLWGLFPLINSWTSGKESKLDFKSLDKLSGKELDKALSKYTKEARLTYKQRRKEIDEIEAEGKQTAEEYNKFLKENPDLLPGGNDDKKGNKDKDDPLSNTINIPTSVGSGKTLKDKAKEQRENELKELQKYNEDLTKEIENNGKRIYSLVQENEDSKVTLMKEGYEKEVAELQRTNEKKIQSLESQVHTEKKLKSFRDEMSKTESELSKAEINKDKKKTDLLQSRLTLLNSVYQQMLVENKQIQENIITSWETYNSKLSTITEKGVNSRIEKKQKEFESERELAKNEFTIGLQQITTLEQAKEQLKEKFSKRELSKIKTINQAREALRKDFEKEDLESQKKHLENLVTELNTMMNSTQWEGMDLTVLTEEQKEAQKKRIKELEAKIAELKQLLGETETEKPTGDGLLSSLGGSKDILGMSPEQWEKLLSDTDLLKEKLAKVVAVAQLMQNAFTAYYEYVNANEQAQVKKYEEHVNHKKETLQKQLDEGYLTQEQYDKKVEKLEKDLDRRKALAEYKSAKRKKQMDIASAISSTSLAILNALSTVKPFWVAMTMSAVAASMGALQLATIKSTPLPSVSGYEKGKYDTMTVKRAQDGKIFKAEYGGESRSGIVNKPTLFLAGEGGKNFPEMIIDGKTLTRMKPDVKEAMYQEVARVNGFEKGYYPSDKYTEAETSSPSYGISFQILEESRKQTKILEVIREQKQYALLDDSPYQILKLKEAQQRAKEIENNGKIV